ncbi:hypothetical protein TNCT_226901 [Trichonephila clavata]|uniref:PiggyBac transposable element-derived protein domain-containing protein n=1 Tax=Trichonephila clavata TaxID=2740835 RepID=A0A8X6HDJ4_TRICU|nr:hypothetical protein TNCT_226901 [Trichonephila clavata]
MAYYNVIPMSVSEWNKSKKWWWPLFTQMIYICVINTWRAYHIANPNEKLSLSDVRREIVLLYPSKKTGSTSKRRGPQGNKLMGRRVSSGVRLIQEITSSCQLKHRRDVCTVR